MRAAGEPRAPLGVGAGLGFAGELLPEASTYKRLHNLQPETETAGAREGEIVSKLLQNKGIRTDIVIKHIREFLQIFKENTHRLTNRN